MNNLKLQTGDIFLTNDYSFASKLVRFLMQSPTIYQQIWRWIRGTLEPVNFYHAGMVLNENEIIEQQTKVQIRPIDRIFRKDYVIWRKIRLSAYDKVKLIYFARKDLGKGYGILECFGKFLTWITGIKYFSKWFDIKDRAICVVRVAEWYSWAGVDFFGVDNANYITTKILHNYCKNHPERWECKYEKVTEVIKKWNLLGEEIK